MTKNIRKTPNVLCITPALAFGGDPARLLQFYRNYDRSKMTFFIVSFYNNENAKNYGTNFTEFIKCPDADSTLILRKSGSIGSKKGVAKIGFGAVKVIQTLFFLRSVIKNNNIDLIDARTGSVPYALICALLMRKKISLTLYGKMGNWLGRVVKPMAKKAEAVVCDSHYRISEINKWINSDYPRYVVIPNPVKVLFSEIPDQFISTFSERKEKEKFIVFTQVAVMLPYKGQKTLIRAFKELVAAGINARLLIVGFARTQEHKQYRQELIALAEELGVSSEIDFYSHAGAIGDVWKLTDVHVHTTYLDSLPNALLEAMSLGIPSIISGVGGIPEVIEHEKNGILIPPHNWQKPFEYMQRLAEDKQYRETLGQNALKTFKQKFEMEKIINDYEDFLINTALK